MARLGFKRSSVLADLASAAVVAAVPILHLAGVLQFWQLVVLVFVLSSVNAQGDTARYALVPFLADRARMPIERANGADRAIVRLGQVVGPILGGILIAAIGAANVLFVDAASFAVSAIAVAIGVPAAANRAESAQAQGGRSYLAELREGLRFVRAHTVLLSMILDRHRGQLRRWPGPGPRHCDLGRPEALSSAGLFNHHEPHANLTSSAASRSSRLPATVFMTTVPRPLRR